MRINTTPAAVLQQVPLVNLYLVNSDCLRIPDGGTSLLKGCDNVSFPVRNRIFLPTTNWSRTKSIDQAPFGWVDGPGLRAL
jgi:hypothetical protein